MSCKNKLKAIFIDQIKFYSLLHILMQGRSLKKVYYFESITPFSSRILALLCVETHQVKHHIGQARGETGESPLRKIRTDSRNICIKIKQEQLVNNPLIKAMGSQWNVDKIILDFEQVIEREVHRECLRIRLSEWLATTQYHLSWDECALFIERNRWFNHLKQYADSKGFELRGYATLKFHILGGRKRVSIALLKNIFGFSKKKGPACSETTSRYSSHKLAIRHCQQRLGFNQLTRSAFFWLNGINIPYSEILLYDFVTDKQLDEETRQEINRRNIKIFGSGPGIQHWNPSVHICRVLLRTLSKYVYNVIICFSHGGWVSPYYIIRLLILTCRYSYWYDFFAANNVRVNVSLTFNGNVAQVLALDDLGGVSAIYQYTMSDIDSPSTLIHSGENILFIYSKIFEDCMFRRCGVPVENVVHVGYLYDNVFKSLVNTEYISGTRKQLQEKGAKLILCFLDENSLNRWDIPASDEEAARDYEYLLRWLLSDPDLGIVFKPKRPQNLFQRISSISNLIGEALQTGRCVFLMEGASVSSVFPSQAAMISDVCVGKLCGSSAAVEARLAGVPTFLIDVEGVHNHPFYTWGRNGVIHRSWESFREVVKKYRSMPNRCQKFGDWANVLEDLDPFQDGHASLRMGLFLEWVYDGLKNNESKQKSIANAREKYAQRWGSQHII